MPRRKQKLRNHRVNDRTLQCLRDSIAAGYPWLHQRRKVDGFYDLLGLVFGRWYGFSDYIDEDDSESVESIWSALRADIIAEHAKRRPGTRPAKWWTYDSSEPRRRLGGVGIVDGRLYFGVPSHYRECDPDDYPEFETERAYLERLKLLTPVEKEIFRKFGDVEFVRISSGDFGKCESCWNKARALADKIGFDLTVAQPYEKFWLPTKLLFACSHSEIYSGVSYDGIFDFET